MDSNDFKETLSKLILEGAEIIAHISYWSREFPTSTYEDSQQQKKELKDYPVIIYNWNEKAKELIKKSSDNIAISDFLEEDSKLVSLKHIDTEMDNGYYSRKAFSPDSEYDPATEQYSAESPLNIITKIIKNKTDTLKSCLSLEIYPGKSDEEVNSIKIIELQKRPGGGLYVYVNKNYSNPFPTNNVVGKNSYWRKIIDLAENKICEKDEEVIKYFNSRKENPLYKRLGYEKTKILEKSGDKMIPLIKIEIIKESKITRSNGQKNKKNN